MVPSNRWFPTSLADRVAWFNNFDTQFSATYAAILGLTLYKTPLHEDYQDFSSVAATRLSAENFRTALADYLRNLTEGAVGSPQPVFPADTFSPPPIGVAAGIFERLDELRTLIMAQPTYTSEIGSALGIETTGSEGIAPDQVKPTITLTAAVHGFLYSVVVTGRHDADQWEVWASPSGSNKFTLAKTSTGKSTDVTFDAVGENPPPTVLQVYVQLKRSDQNYGQPSDIALVTVNP